MKALLLFAACTDVHHHHYELPPAEPPPPEGMAPPFTASTTPDALALDVFGDDGNVWWIGASPAQLEAMNAAYDDGGGWIPESGVYDPGGGDGGTYADVLLLANPDGDAADFGKTEVRLVGQSTGQAWTARTIPNFRLDSDDHTEGQRFGGVEHLRLNNGQVGSMFGEVSSLAVLRALGVPAARASYAWVGGTGWEDPDLLVPMIAREVYKADFCDRNADALGGGCVSVWEGVGDIDTPGVWSSFECDHGDCETTRLDALATAIAAHRWTGDLEAATAEWLDWEAFRRSSCVHWLLWIGDDYVHNTNNVVLVEGQDGRFRFLPYSTDITTGYAWEGAYRDTPLWGWASLSAGCELDPTCREAMYDTCEAVIDDFEALGPTDVIDGLADRLRGTAAPWGEGHPDGMWRGPDDDAYDHYRAFYAGRAASARAELALLRAGGGDTGDTDAPPDTGATPAPIEGVPTGRARD